MLSHVSAIVDRATKGAAMQFGIFSVSDITRNPVTGYTPSEAERISNLVRIAQRADEVGLDVFAIGEHHNPPFFSSSPTTLLAHIAALTKRITLSTAVTLVTTKDPVKIAEDYAMLQHLAKGRLDLMLGRGNTVPVYPWFGKDIRKGLELALENYNLLHRLWHEDVFDWEGSFRTPLQGFTSIPRPLDDVQAIVGLGGHAFIAKRSQDAVRAFRPYFEGSPIYGTSYALEDFMRGTPMSVGSPQEVIEKTLTFQDGFGDYQRQLWVVDAMGLPVEMALEQVELLGTEVVPALRTEMKARRAPGVPDAPSHASRVKARYGDAEPRRPRPNPNRGDNLTGPSPYQDSDSEIAADPPLVR